MDSTVEQGEKSGLSVKPDVSVKTNVRLRQKYYVDEKLVMSSVKESPFKGWQSRSGVIPAERVAISKNRITPRIGNKSLPGEIHAEVIREGQTIKSIRITCPCGRHTELNCEYDKPGK